VAFKKYYADVDFRHHEKPHDPDMVVLTKEQEKERITALMIVFGIVIFFWMTFHQNGFTMTLFAKNYTIHEVGPLTYMFFDLAAFLAIIGVIVGLVLVVNPRIKASGRYIGVALMIVGALAAWYKYTSFSALNDAPPELYLSFNPVFIVFLTPVVVGLFAWLNRRGKEPSSPAKIGIGMVLAGAAFLILVLASWGLPSVGALNGGRSPELVGPFWLISAYFTITIAELFLSPMGLSFVSKVSPPRLKGQMQGGWLAATAVGNGLAGLIGHFYENWELWQFFGLLVCTSLLSAAMVLAVLKRLKRATES
jgi:POT family proton-dependent oligopeptide transporter